MKPMSFEEQMDDSCDNGERFYDNCSRQEGHRRLYIAMSWLFRGLFASPGEEFEPVQNIQWGERSVRFTKKDQWERGKFVIIDGRRKLTTHVVNITFQYDLPYPSTTLMICRCGVFGDAEEAGCIRCVEASRKECERWMSPTKLKQRQRERVAFEALKEMGVDV